ncbi:DUF2087 domain-containing protein [Priestia taiwanensis]|uniref:Transcriptional regulator n=1 Tax=Priestia taiwanensis TaxID=1347902 RepID=A0A917ERR5_9BACI|nr:DUF2087 domain-containing protein [Priestia taiwanensis]MBM7365007.1 hypothetical protein [Priestia taiwanensis]GGE83310.1 transcriptional regulator [Priestia taiwanensis]
MVQEKYLITEEEKQEIIRKFVKDGKLQNLPSKEKGKVSIFLYLIGQFEKGREYKEREVNDILKPIYADFAILRRYLIDYKLLERSKEGLTYWVKE